MDLRKLKTLIDLVSESNVSELEITEAEGKVRIVKSAAAPVMMAAPAVVAAPVATAVAAAAPAALAMPGHPSAPFPQDVIEENAAIGIAADVPAAAGPRMGPPVHLAPPRVI